MSVVRLGYAIGSGVPVEIPIRHMVVTGQTQEAGKTTTLDALITRAGLRAITFVTKRGEGAFTDARRIDPYFREQADWKFVASILEASRGEKLKMERAWIIRASKGASTLADVHVNVKKALNDPKVRGMSADMYLTLDAYLEDVVPQIDRIDWAKRIVLGPGVNAMDLTGISVEMQHLVIRSALDWVLDREENTVVVVPEAWKFMPEGRGTPVKLAAESFIRQGAGLGNYLWIDSQDIAGVDKKTLKQVPIWILGVQREANEIKRTLDNIPASVKKPKASEVATLSLGEFFACWHTHTVRTYVQPTWMNDAQAIQIATGQLTTDVAAKLSPRPVTNSQPIEDPTVKQSEATALQIRNDELEQQNADLRRRLEDLENREYRPRAAVEQAETIITTFPNEDELYRRFKARLVQDAPAVLRVMAEKPEIRVETTRTVIELDGKTPKGRIARLIAKGWFDGDGKTQGATRSELSRTGADVNSGNISTIFSGLVKEGFLTAESGNLYRAVPDMKVHIVER